MLRAACLLVAWAGVVLAAERPSPVTWTLTTQPATVAPGASVLATFTAKPEPGYHIYSATTPKGGPIRTTITLAENPAVKQVQIYQPPPQRKFDAGFQLDTETFEGDTSFLLLVTLAGDAKPGPLALTASARYQTCTEKKCLPPVKRSADTTLTVDPGAKAVPPVIPAGYTELKPDAPEAPAAASAASTPTPSPARTNNQGLLRFLAVAFGFGLATIFTPCVFPMIPIYVSSFLGEQSAKRGDAIRQAALFSIGVIVLFTSLGLVVKAVAGPAGVKVLAASPWVNGFIALVFLTFGLSLLGAFEITLPSGLLTKLNAGSQQGGFLGAILMGLTFSLASFACVGPFVGTLLAASVQESGGLQPVLGMVAFATGLTLPFFSLALFPGLLSRLPRRGGWMGRVKVVMGFVILAAMLKYLSNVDQVLALNLLTRERFLAAWVVLFALPGLYLLGLLRFEGVNPEDHLGVGRLLTAASFLIFSISLLPGLFGARLGELDSYVPASETAGLALPGSGPGAGGATQVWQKNQLAAALAQAKTENRMVLAVFTGVTCTNCHWMKANMFPRPAVAEAVKNMILVELYTDGTDDENKRNQELQDKQFSTVEVPLYVIYDSAGKVVAKYSGSTRDEQEFLKFLTTKPAFASFRSRPAA